MVEGGESSKYKLVGISLLVLTVLLTASVSSLIYVAVYSSQTACGNAKPVEKSAEVEINAKVNLKTGDKEVNSWHCISCRSDFNC